MLADSFTEADIARQFLTEHAVHRYRMKKIADIPDSDIGIYCHWYCEENHLVPEWRAFKESLTAGYHVCSALHRYVSEGLCYDVQMIAYGYIQPTSLPGIPIERTLCAEHCAQCMHRL